MFEKMESIHGQGDGIIGSFGVNELADLGGRSSFTASRNSSNPDNVLPGDAAEKVA